MHIHTCTTHTLAHTCTYTHALRTHAHTHTHYAHTYTHLHTHTYTHLHTCSKMKGCETEERLIYQIIEDSGNKGIWIRDIRNKSNLLQTQIMRTLKSLESKQFIKSVKSVQATKKKVYMLHDLVPDESITGGAWYSDQDFESEFVEVLNHHCLNFLKQKVCLSVCPFVRHGIVVAGLIVPLNVNHATVYGCGWFVFSTQTESFGSLLFALESQCTVIIISVCPPGIQGPGIS